MPINTRIRHVIQYHTILDLTIKVTRNNLLYNSILYNNYHTIKYITTIKLYNTIPDNTYLKIP
jgi:hypothetical protein